MATITYTGRMGTLTVALGVGAAVFTGWGCAVASADDSGTTTSDASSTHSRSGPAEHVDRSPRAKRSHSRDRGGRQAEQGATLPRLGLDRSRLSDRYGVTKSDDPPIMEVPSATGGNRSKTSHVTVPSVQTIFARGGDNSEVKPSTRISELTTPSAGPSASNGTDPLPTPTVSPALWTLLAGARRGDETKHAAKSLDKPAEVQTTSELFDVAAQDSIVFTAPPNLFDHVVVSSLRVLRGISNLVGVDIYGLLAKALERDKPPTYLTRRLDVEQTQYEIADGSTWQVWEFHPLDPTGKTVVAIHGGGFLVEPLTTNWKDYANMARDTGATVIVPLYPLATTEAGSATKVVPGMAQLISDQIAAHGAQNVSVYADSAGTILAMSALRQLVLDKHPIPASVVLLSPAPDASLSNPAIREIDDPVINVDDLDFYDSGGYWAKGFDPKDPMVSPLFIEDAVLAAMPPTTIYIGTLEIGLPDTLLFWQKWNTAGGTVSLVIGQGQIHDWALGGSINSQASKVRPDIYRQLGLTDSAAGPITITI